MKFAPMLAQSAQPKTFPTYIKDDNWVAEQKLDGQRLLLRVDGGIVYAANRAGEQTTVDRTIREPFESLTGEWCFDGETLGGKFWIFDMPYALDLVSPDDDYDTRRQGLETVFAVSWQDEDRLKLVDAHRTPEEKQEIFDWCMANGAEGIMFKDRRSKYVPGKRAAGFVKAKFVDTVDAIVVEISPQGKSSCVVGLFVPGETMPTAVGSVKFTEANLATVRLGDVISVKYLYFTKDRRLYQARFESFRRDKKPHECLLDSNLRMVNKTVRTDAT